MTLSTINLDEEPLRIKREQALVKIPSKAKDPRVGKVCKKQKPDQFFHMNSTTSTHSSHALVSAADNCKHSNEELKKLLKKVDNLDFNNKQMQKTQSAKDFVMQYKSGLKYAKAESLCLKTKKATNELAQTLDVLREINCGSQTVRNPDPSEALRPSLDRPQKPTKKSPTRNSPERHKTYFKNVEQATYQPFTTRETVNQAHSKIMKETLTLNESSRTTNKFSKLSFSRIHEETSGYDNLISDLQEVSYDLSQLNESEFKTGNFPNMPN